MPLDTVKISLQSSNGVVGCGLTCANAALEICCRGTALKSCRAGAARERLASMVSVYVSTSLSSTLVGIGEGGRRVCKQLHSRASVQWMCVSQKQRGRA
jgi:hypothetical protein